MMKMMKSLPHQTSKSTSSKSNKAPTTNNGIITLLALVRMKAETATQSTVASDTKAVMTATVINSVKNVANVKTNTVTAEHVIWRGAIKTTGP